MKAYMPLSLAVIAGLLAAGCTGNQVTATPAVLPSSTPGLPQINVKPATVSANTPMMVTGSGFPAEARVRVYLGAEEMSNILQPYGEGVADADGRLAIALTMPDRWPDGSLITETNLIATATTEDLGIQATVPFSFQPTLAALPTPTRSQPTAIPLISASPTNEPLASVNYAFLNVRSGPGVSYDLIARLNEGDTLTLLGRNGDSTWGQVRLPDGRQGWVSLEYIQTRVEIASLPVTLPASTATPAPASEQDAALNSALRFYTLWASGPGPNGKLEEALQNVSKTLADQIRADNSSLLRLLNAPSRPRYTQVEVLRFDGQTALIRATLQLDAGSRVVDTTLARENGAWVIVKFQPV